MRAPIVLLFAAALSAQWLDPDRSEPAGTSYATFPSKLAGGEVSYLVALPPGYENSQQRYPVIYHLHPLNSSPRDGGDFVRYLQHAIRNGRAPAAVAVLVNGLRSSFYCDSPDGRRPVESVIVKELVPHIDATYRTIAQREARAVEGYSMGGFGAAHLAFKYPEVFGAAAILAGPFPDARTAAANRGALANLFAADWSRYQAEHPFTLLEHNADAIRGRMRIRIAVGDRDSLQALSQMLHERLAKLKIEHEYEVVPGVAHSGRAFYAAVGARHFEFYRAPQPRFRGPYPVTAGKSNVVRRGDLEILTFESEAEWNALQASLAETETVRAQPGAITKLWFRSPTDGSVQPYAIALPKAYDPASKYPLVVQLHGLDFNKKLAGERRRFSGMGRPDGPWVDGNLPVIVAQAFGRQSTFYQGQGEEDVLEVTAEASRRFPIDPERVYLMGHSMGGAGAYSIALHYPDRFAGALAIDPAMGRELAIPADLPKWMEPQAALYRPEKLFPNARNLPVYFKSAGAGIQGDSTAFSDGILTEGGFSTTEVFSGLPHNFAGFMPYSAFLPQVALRPIRRRPAEVKFATTNLRYHRAYWLNLDRISGAATITALARPDSVKVITTNVEAFTLDLPEGEGRVLIDGQAAFAGKYPRAAHFERQGGAWKNVAAPALAGKRHGMQGPIADALNSRFMAVYGGEADRELAVAELDGLRNPDGALYAAADFPMKAAAKVTPEDVRTSNLILFGTPESNPVLKRIASSLPAPLLREPSIFIHPNPENPGRYVVVWNARLLSLPEKNGLTGYGWFVPILLLPDWVVVKDGQVVSGGHFDNAWGSL